MRRQKRAREMPDPFRLSCRAQLRDEPLGQDGQRSTGPKQELGLAQCHLSAADEKARPTRKLKKEGIDVHGLASETAVLAGPRRSSVAL